MTEEQILEGNKLIADFLEWRWHDSYTAYGVLHHEGYYSGDIQKDGFMGVHPADLKFHSSWDWLMPVVEKIHDECKLPQYTYGLKYFLNMTVFCGIKTLWFAVIEFIKWYNKNK